MNTIRKDFKHGDMYITTSHRQVRHMGICGGVAGIFTGGYFDKDITIEQAIEIHTINMQHSYPRMNITKEMVKDVLTKNPDGKYFLNMDGEVISYDNHEKPDIFDVRFLNGEDIDKLSKEKEQWLDDHGITEGNWDDDGEIRCWED